MEREDLFHKTIGILFKAYLNSTLQLGNSCACAIGNLVSARLGLKTEVVFSTLYNKEMITWVDEKPHWWTMNNLVGHMEQLAAIEYSYTEVQRIEKAFESERRKDLVCPASKWKREDEYVFLGLAKVVDTLMDIHKVGEEEKREVVSQFKAIRESRVLKV